MRGNKDEDKNANRAGENQNDTERENITTG
jgi:hypothetical protein